MGSGTSSGRGTGGGNLTTGAATSALNSQRQNLGRGNAPDSVTVNGVTYNKTRQGQYESNGGYIVHTYEYRSSQAPDDKSTLTFNATDYNAPDGTRMRRTNYGDDLTRRKPRLFDVELTSGVLYTSGSSGGIGRTSSTRSR